MPSSGLNDLKLTQPLVASLKETVGLSIPSTTGVGSIVKLYSSLTPSKVPNNKKIEKLIQIISKVTKINKNEINYESKSSNFERWDSLVNVNLMIEIEKKYKVKIPTSMFESLNSIKKISKFLNL